MRRDGVGYYCGMAQFAQILLELLPPGPLAAELVMLFIAVLILRQLSPVVRTSLDDKFPFPKVAGHVDAFFVVAVPIAIVAWFVSIAARYGLSF